MRYRKQRFKGLKITAIVLAVLLLISAVGGVLWWMTEEGLLGKKEPPPAATFAEGAVRAMSLPAPGEELADEASLRAYYREALEYAAANGYNTLVAEAKTGVHIWWRDKRFPTVQHIAGQDRLFGKKLDPIALLCEEAAGRPVQLWLLLDPFAHGAVSSEEKGSVVDLLLKEGGDAALTPTNAELSELVAGLLEELPQRYGVAGVVLTGFGAASAEGIADVAAWQGAYTTLLEGVRLGWDTLALPTRLHLQTEASSPLLTADWYAGLRASATVDTLMAPVGDSVATAQHALAVVQGAEGSLVAMVDPTASPSGLGLFTAGGSASYAGLYLGEYPAVQQQSAEIGFLESTLTPVQRSLPSGFHIEQTLRVNYPAATDTIGAAQAGVYVMGNSDPSQPLLLNGAEVTRGGTQGTFGVYVELQDGENVLTFQQGDTVLEHVISRPNYPTAPSSPPPAEEEEPEAEETEEGEEDAPQNAAEDGTLEAPPGQAVQVAGTFAGALTSPHDESAINETLYKGAVAVVQGSVLTERYNAAYGRNVLTWAYQLTSGDYIAAQNVTWVENGASAFTGISAEADAAGEWLLFEGSGTPAATIACEGGELAVTMHDTSFELPEGFTSELVTAASVEPLENGVVLRLSTQNLWGWQIDYNGGATRLFLKRAPTLGADPLRPLEGVRVMLDPGHGDEDAGAPGIMGATGPNEKDLNLAQAQAIAYRLEQLGATVIMTRDDDETFHTTQERLAMLMEEKPDFFLSVHHNSAEMNGDRSGATGMQVYYYVPPSYSAPGSARYGQNLMDANAVTTGRPASEAYWGYYNVLRTAVCPAVLYEYAFMVSPVDFEDAASAQGQYQAAFGTAEGIVETLRSQGAAPAAEAEAPEEAETPAEEATGEETPEA